MVKNVFFIYPLAKLKMCDRQLKFHGIQHCMYYEVNKVVVKSCGWYWHLFLLIWSSSLKTILMKIVLKFSADSHYL